MAPSTRISAEVPRPDAGQIDINLRYALFFAEKRPFFLEGQDSFNLTDPTGLDPLEAIVHTRTIVNPLVGVKLSGKLGTDDTLASLYALDELPSDGSVAGEGRYAQSTAVRYKRSLGQDSYLGAVYTGRERHSGFNRVFGSDGHLRVNPSSAVSYHAFVSRTGAGTGTATTGGHALGFAYVFDTRNLTLNAAGVDISTDFKTETGYLTRTGISTIRGYFGPKFYPKSHVIRRITPSLRTEQSRDRSSGVWETLNAASFRVLLPRNTNLGLQGIYSTEVFGGVAFTTSGVMATASTQLTKRFYVSAAYRHQGAIYYSSDPFHGPFQHRKPVSDLPAIGQLAHGARRQLRGFRPARREPSADDLRDSPQQDHLPGEPLPVFPWDRGVQQLQAAARHGLSGFVHLHPGYGHSPRVRFAV